MEEACRNNTTAVFNIIYSFLVIHVPKWTLCCFFPAKYPALSIEISSSHELRNLVWSLPRDLSPESSTQHLSIQHLTSFIPSPKPWVVIWTNSLNNPFSPFLNGHTALLLQHKIAGLVVFTSCHTMHTIQLSFHIKFSACCQPAC